MEDITVENANDMMAKAKISDTTYTKQAAAWVIINQFCHQSGLYHNREDDDLSGIQKVIKYLSETQAENKALREEINALNGDIQSYRNGHEVNAKRYNDLLIERNKLGEENTKCKELSWEAANEILRLKKEIERLEAEVLKEKFPEN